MYYDIDLDIVGNSLISRKIFGYLDFDSLRNASDVNEFWMFFLYQERSLWVRHLREAKIKAFALLSHNWSSDKQEIQWTDSLQNLEIKGSIEELIEIVKLIEDYLQPLPSGSRYPGTWPMPNLLKL